MGRVQEHRNGVQSIDVEILSILDEDGKETNSWYNKKPGTRANMVRGEAERLITAGRAIATADKKKTAPKNRKAAAPTIKRG